MHGSDEVVVGAPATCMHKNGKAKGLQRIKGVFSTTCFVFCIKNKGEVWRNIDSVWLMELRRRKRTSKGT